MLNFDGCKSMVSDLIFEALEYGEVLDLAVWLNVDERSVRRWRDRKVLPQLPYYLALCEYVNRKGDVNDIAF